MDACLRSCKKERTIVSVLSLALIGNTFSVLNRIQREELMGWHASGVKRTTDWSYRCQEPITSAPAGFKWHFDQRKGILVRVSGEFELLFEFELAE